MVLFGRFGPKIQTKMKCLIFFYKQKICNKTYKQAHGNTQRHEQEQTASENVKCSTETGA